MSTKTGAQRRGDRGTRAACPDSHQIIRQLSVPLSRFQFGQIHLAIWSNTFSNLYKYTLQFRFPPDNPPAIRERFWVEKSGGKVPRKVLKNYCPDSHQIPTDPRKVLSREKWEKVLRKVQKSAKKALSGFPPDNPPAIRATFKIAPFTPWWSGNNKSWIRRQIGSCKVLQSILEKGQDCSPQ